MRKRMGIHKGVLDALNTSIELVDLELEPS